MRWSVLALVLTLLSAAAGVAETPPNVAAELHESARRNGTIRVIVQLRHAVTPEPLLAHPQQVQEQRAGIARAQSALQSRMQSFLVRKFISFEYIAAVSLETDEDGLADLLSNPMVERVDEDRPAQAQLTESVPLVRADGAWSLGYRGQGQTIAVIDTGVDRSHPFLTGAVIYEACYSSGGISFCPNGATSQIGIGAAAPCVHDTCEHGTHVAGIAAGLGPSFSGVAKGATIIAINVFSLFPTTEACPYPCIRTSATDQILALQRVYALRNSYRIASVNMSLGGDRYRSQSECDAAESTRKQHIDLLRLAGIAVIVSSMNNNYSDSIGAPACISSAISVGNTTKDDVLYTASGGSNIASFLNFVAPGTAILSSVPNRAFNERTGTSMSAPHVAGAWAVLRSAYPEATVNDIAAALAVSGRQLTLTRTTAGGTYTYVKPRIDVRAALSVLGSIGAAPQAGWWWNANESGRGFSIERRGGNLFFATFLYGTDQYSQWLIASGAMSTSRAFSGSLYEYRNGQTLSGSYRAASQYGNWGTLSLNFTSATTGLLTWPGGTIPIQRYDIVSGGVARGTPAGYPQTGWWWSSSESGRGYFLEVQGTTMFLSAYMYDTAGFPTWYVASGLMTSASLFQGTLYEYCCGQSMSDSYRPPTVLATHGTVTIQFNSTTTATITLPSGRQIAISRFLF